MRPNLHERAERVLGAVHLRRVEAPHARLECVGDHGSGERGVVPESVPGAEPDDGAEPAFLHQVSIRRAATPAA